MNKVFDNADSAIHDIKDGSVLMLGGFGLCGIPENCITALVSKGVKGLTCISNNAGVDDFGIGLMLQKKLVKKMIASYVGENAEFERQLLSGELEVELIPQGTLAERLRAGGAGIPAFYTPAGVGTQVADGGMPWRYAPDGSIALPSPAKETREFDGRSYVLERGITTDFALVRASVGDRHGNLVFDKSTRNFNPLVASAGRITIAEVEELVEPGEIDPQNIHTPGVFVQRVVPLSSEQSSVKRIERRTVSKEA